MISAELKCANFCANTLIGRATRSVRIVFFITLFLILLVFLKFLSSNNGNIGNFRNIGNFGFTALRASFKFQVSSFKNPFKSFKSLIGYAELKFQVLGILLNPLNP